MASLFDQILSGLTSSPSQSNAAAAAPSAFPAQNISSIFDLVRVPSPGQFNVTAASGTKPKNYKPTQINMSGIPTPSVFSLLGLGDTVADPFTVTPASGTKPKNYKPVQISMNMPSLAGPEAMQQMLAMMGNNYGATPFAPNGQG